MLNLPGKIRLLSSGVKDTSHRSIPIKAFCRWHVFRMGKIIVPLNYVFPNPLKTIRLSEPGIRIS